MKAKIHDPKSVLEMFISYLFTIIFKFFTCNNLAIYIINSHLLFHKLK